MHNRDIHNHPHPDQPLVDRVLEMMDDDINQQDIVEYIIRSGVQPQAAIAFYDHVKAIDGKRNRKAGLYWFVAGALIYFIGYGLFWILREPVTLYFIIMVFGNLPAWLGIRIVLWHPGNPFAFLMHILLFALIIIAGVKAAIDIGGSLA